MQSSRALPIGALHAAAVGASEASAAAREASAAAAAASRASPSPRPVAAAAAAPHPKVFIDRSQRPATAEASPTVRQARPVVEVTAPPQPAPAPAPSAALSRAPAPPLHRNASSLSHTCGAARGDALAAASEQQQQPPQPGALYGHGRGGRVDPQQREPPASAAAASTQAQMRSSVFSNGDEASTAQHATSKTLLRVAIAELPPHASEGEIKRRLGALGLEASDVRVQLNPLSGEASGRGEITFRNVADKRSLLDVLHRQPSALLHGRATQLLFDDTDHKHGRGGA